MEEKGEASVCCQKAVGKLKAEFETRLAALEGKMNDRQKDKEYADYLKECISHWEEQIVAMRERLKAKDDLIDEMRKHISTSDDKTAELLAKVEKLTAVVENGTKAEIIETKKSQKVQNRHPSEDKLKSTFAVGYGPRYFSHYRISKCETRPVPSRLH